RRETSLHRRIVGQSLGAGEVRVLRGVAVGLVERGAGTAAAILPVLCRQRLARGVQQLAQLEILREGAAEALEHADLGAVPDRIVEVPGGVGEIGEVATCRDAD